MDKPGYLQFCMLHHASVIVPYWLVQAVLQGVALPSATGCCQTQILVCGRLSLALARVMTMTAQVQIPAILSRPTQPQAADQKCLTKAA